MKRKDLIKHLLKNGCIFLREGARHSVFFNSLLRKSSTVPRHIEIDNFLAKKICRDLGISSPKRK
ncbi:addiction module toxin, HicA family [Candidatus Jorgensenbacteria bacterium CG_4_10_14_0_8_um_filter_39_13]|uniref:Addiction module toxin, HicA family n=2 Tax=Candidatus Joergenseniibacteriota TaxID=1752739 RepID=A0A2M7RIJ7_9BACT|nr:MAG: addiction module toxin, HicA family [Candidatus Jorgensenbacteria bacterium CG11_big_fil_rev_8_21_14_0_20_38_23]PIV12954.1 MAG: addiction module toxin, HicA family [Candidatus Jorgensenbacteria bacterium CG03_land_8_20_14_0_80_38_39]PIW97767.1 MAG: addiction module toxin, HicA family [Candidatus Jorgensenbacteria bacterium CG_4_8_14_3_um_filter_38_10]PIY96206.1 MAG: addiction module toxin, HicA family [Candidatus Jorgensenbacteria bacterium CG_4_10_14_0_8_um_filter_39_13]PJA95134.1 MAG: